ncbi:dTDP-4-dehydrorhamnose reductase [Lapillicoccus sp.]|uniref:dTDP-4-dehydrorhamnose reductase n=1 Tax=Lapillicoccus sp. TaxID=1909287 RepID=UPI0032649B40
MRILVTGGLGMLGSDLNEVLTDAGHDVTVAGRSDLDITNPDACQSLVHGHDTVVNAAAWTAVDDAETHEAEAFDVNATGAANLARASRAAGARLVHISTDYVFRGDATAPYAEDSPLAPRSAYGRTKAAGEWAVGAIAPESYVVRTAWLYGEHGPNFVKTMARLAGERPSLSVVDDQRGQPTWTHDLAVAVESLLSSDAPFGIYHGTSSGETTKFGFTREIFRLLGLDPDRVLPTTTDAFPLPASRPAYSVLGHEKWAQVGLPDLPDWQTSLRRAISAVIGVRT